MWRFWVPVGLILASIFYGVLAVEFFSATSTSSAAHDARVLATFYAMGIVPGVISMIGLVVYRLGQTYVGGAILFVLPALLVLPALYSLFAPGPNLAVTCVVLFAAAIIAIRRQYDRPGQNGAG